MLLYLVRHGIAVTVGENGVTCDRERMLSAEGVARTKAAAAGLASLGCQVDRVVSSPLARARETAKLFRDCLAPKLRVEAHETLSGSEEVAQTLLWLKNQPLKTTMLVGHMPHIAELASALLADEERAVDFVFKKAAVCCIQCGGKPLCGGARLEWLLQPRMLRELAGDA